MEIVKKNYVVALTEEEVRRLTDALDCECEYLRERVAELKSSPTQEDVMDGCEMEKDFMFVQNMRNDFGNLIGRTYTTFYKIKGE